MINYHNIFKWVMQCAVPTVPQIHCKEKKRNFIGLPPTNFKNKNVFGFNDTTFELDVGRNIDVDVVSGCSIRSTFDVKMAILRFRWNHWKILPTLLSCVVCTISTWNWGTAFVRWLTIHIYIRPMESAHRPSNIRAGCVGSIPLCFNLSIGNSIYIDICSNTKHVVEPQSRGISEVSSTTMIVRT